MKKNLLFLFIVPIFLYAKINVTVSILPQKYFVKKIAGQKANVEVMVLPGNEPATYEPKPRQLIHLSKSKIYFTIGVPFEKTWIPRFKNINPKLLIINTAKGIKKRNLDSCYSFDKIKTEQKVKSSAKDPHIWLSPVLVKTISLNIANAFIKIDPAHKKTYLTNLKNFYKEIDNIITYGNAKFKNLKKREFIVFHPAWGYFAEEFHLKQIPIQIEEKSPKISTLTKLIKYAKKENIKIIFVQPEFSEKSAKVIAENIHGRVVALNPLEENWTKSMKKAINSFSKVLSNEQNK